MGVYTRFVIISLICTLSFHARHEVDTPGINSASIKILLFVVEAINEYSLLSLIMIISRNACCTVRTDSQATVSCYQNCTSYVQRGGKCFSN